MKLNTPGRRMKNLEKSSRTYCKTSDNTSYQIWDLTRISTHFSFEKTLPRTCANSIQFTKIVNLCFKHIYSKHILVRYDSLYI